jgi:tetratricopeptide (TPR) repeat protein
MEYLTNSNNIDELFDYNKESNKEYESYEKYLKVAKQKVGKAYRKQTSIEQRLKEYEFYRNENKSFVPYWVEVAMIYNELEQHTEAVQLIKEAITELKISKFEKVPDKPPVRTINTIIVPCNVTRPRYILLSKTPSGAQPEPNKVSIIPNFSSGHPICNLNNAESAIPTIPIIMAVSRYCLAIIL